MHIALDYDDTFSKDPESWIKFCKDFQAKGHTIYGVTFRYNDGPEFDNIDTRFLEACDEVYFTSRQPKARYMFDRGLVVHVWIDDCPELIVGGLAHHRIVHWDDEIISVEHTGEVAGGISWDTLYHIKNAKWGEEAEVIELYPAASRLVNNANIRHLWRVPEGMVLPDLDGGWPKPSPTEKGAPPVQSILQ